MCIYTHTESIYIYISIKCIKYYTRTIDNRYPKTRKTLSKPGVHILLPRLRPQHVPGNELGKTTRHRLMPQNHSICFRQMEVLFPKIGVPKSSILKGFFIQNYSFGGTLHLLKWALKQIKSALPRQFRCRPPRNLSSFHGMIWKHKLFRASARACKSYVFKI